MVNLFCLVEFLFVYHKGLDGLLSKKVHRSFCLFLNNANTVADACQSVLFIACTRMRADTHRDIDSRHQGVGQDQDVQLEMFQRF